MAIKHLSASPAIDRFLSLYPLPSPFYYRCDLVWLSHLEEKLKKKTKKNQTFPMLRPLGLRKEIHFSKRQPKLLNFLCHLRFYPSS